MNFSIRRFQPTDQPILVKLMGEFNKFIVSIDATKRTQYATGSSEYFTNKMIQLCETKHGAIFVMQDGAEIIGFVSGYVDTQDADEQIETIAAVPGVIGELFVLEQYRGQGCGKQLLTNIENYLKEQGCTIIRFAVFALNTKARQFYREAGYTDRLVQIMKELQ